MEKTYSILFKKINYDAKEVYFFLKPTKVIKTRELNFDYSEIKSKYTDELAKIDNQNLWISDNKLIYGYNLDEKVVFDCYPKLKKEYIENTLYNDISGCIYIGKYNKSDDTTIILNLYKDVLEEVVGEVEFSDLGISLDENSKLTACILNQEKIKKYINLLENNKTEEVKNFFEEVLNRAEEYEKLDISQIINGSQNNNSQKNEGEVINTTLENELNSLRELVGIKNIKDKVNELITYLEFIDKVKENVEMKNPNLHMLYTGNPGTGKTTVARIMSRILYLLGYTKSNKFVEATPKDFIGEYVGQTAPKTAEFIKNNKDGIIFIDEAYDFAGIAQEFGGEALVEIIKEMEKNETIFIFAGYKDEMNDFVKMNPGLASRLGYYLEFKDYSTEELMEIFKLKLKKTKFKVSENALMKIYNILEKIDKSKNFGNGRFIDKLFDKIIIKHAINVKKSNDINELIKITENDIDENLVNELIYSENNKVALGFQYTKKRILGGKENDTKA